MSREILFRAWHKSTKRMLDRNLLDRNWYIDNKVAYVATSEDRYTMEIMQFTGLLDSEGKKIFEGDVISYPSGMIRECIESESDQVIDGRFYKTEPNKIREIVSSAPSFCVKNGSPLGSRHLNEADIKIIGNIFENKELLEKGK